MIQTITGKISANELGVCAAHEHLSIDLSRIKNNPDTILNDEVGMGEELGHFHRAGGRAMVELTNEGMGRNLERLRRLSKKTGVHIIACTGFYKDPYIPGFADGWSADEFADFFIKEATQGINGTGIYPGVIGEVGTSENEIKPIEGELLAGAALAGKATGLVVSTHTTLGTIGIRQIELMTRQGLPTDQLIVGHQDLNPNKEEVLEVLKTGAYIGFDTIGKTNYRSDEDRLSFLLEFIEAGYHEQVLLSADLTRKSHWKKHGGPGYDLVLREFIPKLRGTGVSEKIIDDLLIHNPAKVFRIREKV